MHGQSLCQCNKLNFSTIFKLFFIFLVSFSCAKHTVVDVLPPIDAAPVWFKMDDRFSESDEKGQIPSHPFFDLAPVPNVKDLSLNFYPVTLKESPFLYGFDLVSGKRYVRHPLCEQKDVWGAYSKKITSPPFTEGVVPRLLDSLGFPQKIIVFGAAPEMNPFQARSFRVRIIGGVVEQYCAHYPCRSLRDRWQSRPVLVAVNPNVEGYAAISNLAGLKEVENWPGVLAYLQNAYGRSQTLIHKEASTDEDRPAFRVVQEISAPKIFGYVFKKGHLFKFDEMKMLKYQCGKLYDSLWQERESLRMKGRSSKGEEFPRYFETFYEKFGRQFYTCSKYVKAGSLENSPDRFWFFTYVQAFFNLTQLGHIFSCSRAAWEINPYYEADLRDKTVLKELRLCKGKQLDYAFTRGIAHLNGAYLNNLEHYRFIEYDQAEGGTHQKIDSWIFGYGKSLACEKRPVKNKIGTSFEASWINLGGESKNDDLVIKRQR